MKHKEKISTIKRINTPLQKKEIQNLQAGDQVLISGILYTARDAAHKRLVESIAKKEPLPFTLQNSILYYVGPSPAKPGEIIGSAGPTTSYRMDAYSVQLIKLGLKGMIGKGMRSSDVIEAMKEYSSVYFTAIGGAGALLSNSIISSAIIAYEDLGTEAIRELVVKDFPVIVTIDMYGNNLYETEPPKFKKS